MIDVTRSFPPPKSLEACRGWRADDVMERLWEDFLGKCYLCESPIGRDSFEVDHRRPRGDGGGIFDWRNLFPVCERCNKLRPRKWPEGGLLDPSGGDQVEGRLVQKWDCEYAFDKSQAVFAPVKVDDRPAVNTADELRFCEGAVMA